LHMFNRALVPALSRSLAGNMQRQRNIGNALFGGGPAPIPGLVTFTVEWSGIKERVKIRNNNSPSSGGGFAGDFIRNAAQMQWTATVGDFLFVSDPLTTSSSSFAEIGHERNGSFFP